MPSENPSVSSQPPENNTPTTSKISAEKTSHQPLATAHLSKFSRALALSTALATATPALAENSAENQPAPNPTTAPQKISTENSTHPTDYIAQMAKNALNAVIPTAEAAETTLEKPPYLSVDLENGTVTIYRKMYQPPECSGCDWSFVDRENHEKNAKYEEYQRKYGHLLHYKNPYPHLPTLDTKKYDHDLNEEELAYLSQFGVRPNKYPNAAEMSKFTNRGVNNIWIQYPLVEISAEKNGDTPPDGLKIDYEKREVSSLFWINQNGKQIDISTGEEILVDDFNEEQKKYMSKLGIKIGLFNERIEGILKIGNINLLSRVYKMLSLFAPIILSQPIYG